jgi:type IV pilus assembly protein PilE
MMRNKVCRGFTLIELMIAVAVVAVLAAVAYPAYTDYIRQSRRAEAQAYLMAVADWQTQYFNDTSGGYQGTLGSIGVAQPANVVASYDIAASAVAGPPATFTITATPKTSQASERCGTLSIDQTGTKTAAHSDCW